ncbi:GH36-type glycosyl hydrolase domain-containing protein [Calditrichota bacterium]
MHVKIANLSEESLQFIPTSAIPIFGRSAENIRDHRHATSLIQRMRLIPEGIIVKPVIIHDERGHKENNVSYFVAGFDGEGDRPTGQFPTVREFIGESGGFDWPIAVVKNKKPENLLKKRHYGLEAVGALRFETVQLEYNETKEFVLILGITDDETEIPKILNEYSSSKKVTDAFNKNCSHWNEKVNRILFDMGNPGYSNWMKWVSVQPVIRKIYGCSFLPHHDYGKGGRGWRDLWQDCLALLIQKSEDIRETLENNFYGVRPDGTNATIIGKGEREFAADRNNISRVWMDHGVWPYFTIRLYIDQTGDFDILSRTAAYWYDHQVKRAKARNLNWQISDGKWVKTADGSVYEGSILEHILVQHLTSFFNVGEHNMLKLEDADWNDQLDMAPVRGESVAFSSFYAGNLSNLSSLLAFIMKINKIRSVEMASEIGLLLDTISEPVDYDSYFDKITRLESFLTAVKNGFSGKMDVVNIEKLIYDLTRKSEWLSNQICNNEWIDVDKEIGFFNGYYNNDGERVDGIFNKDVRMNLTAQTFVTMFDIASDEQVQKSFKACTKFLIDPNTKGYRLTTPLGPNTFNFGRGFALVYGEKENGAMFSHMAVMYTNALYRRGFVKEGYRVLSSIYNLCTDTKKAGIYPGIPEYISFEGKGMYHYLTGSASWLVMTMLTQVFGFRGYLGDLVISPKFVKEQFSQSDTIGILACFAGKQIEVKFENKKKLNFGDYILSSITLNGNSFNEFDLRENGKMIRISRNCIKDSFNDQNINSILIILDQGSK